MQTTDWFKDKLEAFKDDFEFRLEGIILDITEMISKRMLQKKLNKSAFARKLNVSPAAVTKILNGTSNFTLRRLLSIAETLDLELKVGFLDKEAIFVVPETYFYQTDYVIRGIQLLASASVVNVESIAGTASDSGNIEYHPQNVKCFEVTETEECNWPIVQ